jgi:hypothetical protein
MTAIASPISLGVSWTHRLNQWHADGNWNEKFQLWTLGLHNSAKTDARAPQCTRVLTYRRGPHLTEEKKYGFGVQNTKGYPLIRYKFP